ncbi:DNA adenine methylase [Clostridium sp. C2-6-12]|uniref:DNA adenine methylase n=1 Tax=Clostridium sp. C2-6-12 TaxID=2698832 RepID=UPI00136E1039|nr:DNA adenine methylase [Clostridium sp. C2-6-12]
MDKEFIEFLKKIVPDGTGSTKAYNADNTITEEELTKLSKIGRADHETSCTIMKELLDARQGKTIPMLYRRTIFFIAYSLYDELKTEGVQNKVIEDLGLAHNTFTKWGLEPVRYYREGHDWGADIELHRDGKKSLDLLYLFNAIISREKYIKFVDLFGGLGAVTASRHMRKGTKGYVNDWDKSVANFLAVIKFKPKELEDECKNLLQEIKAKRKKKILDIGKVEYQKRIDNQREKGYNASRFLGGTDEDTKRKKVAHKLEISEYREEIEYSLGIYTEFRDEIKKYQNSKTVNEEKNGFIFDEDRADVKRALEFYYLHSFEAIGKNAITGVNEKNYKKFTNNIYRISEYSKRLKDVEIRCSSFKNVIEDEKINKEDTLIYSDSPYYRTKQYDKGFTDADHIALHDSLKNFKGKWIFSCRDRITNNNKNRNKDKKIGEVKIGNIVRYFEMYADIAKYVIRYEKHENHKYEIMITNFDFVAPTVQGLKAHKAELKNKEYEYVIDGERGIIKETYEEFLDRIRKENRDIS